MENRGYKYEILGFTVLISNPEFKEAFGDQYLDIDNGKFMKSVFRALINKPARISGAELKFIRTYMGFSQEEFVQIVFGGDLNRATISKWEANKHTPAGMSFSEENTLRMRMTILISERTTVQSYCEKTSDKFKGSADVGEEISIPYEDVKDVA